MANSNLDIWRHDLIDKRVNGRPGGNRVVWQGKDLPIIYDEIMSARPEQIARAARPAETKFSAANIDKVSLAKMGIVLRSDIAPEDHPVCVITTPRKDLANDAVDTANVDCTDFAKFCQVLDTHDSSKPPVALSTVPWMSGTSMLAIAKFPKPGVSADSDRIAAVVRAGLQRGTSIGFVPLKWSFSKDPARPLGIDFHAIKLLEWSFCAQPCNQDCRVIGSVSGTNTSPQSNAKMADLRRDALAVAAKARAISQSIPDPVPMTREQRIAQAAEFRRTAYRV